MRDRLSETMELEAIGASLGIDFQKRAIAEGYAIYIPYDGSQLYGLYKPEDFRRIDLAPNTQEEAESQALKGRIAYNYLKNKNFPIEIAGKYEAAQHSLAPYNFSLVLGAYPNTESAPIMAAIVELGSEIMAGKAYATGIKNIQSVDIKAEGDRLTALCLEIAEAIDNGEADPNQIALLATLAYHLRIIAGETLAEYLARIALDLSEAIKAHEERAKRVKPQIDQIGKDAIAARIGEVLYAAIKEGKPEKLKGVDELGSYFFSLDAAKRLSDLLGEVQELEADSESLAAIFDRVNAIDYESEGEPMEETEGEPNRAPYALKPHGKLAIAIEGGTFGRIQKARAKATISRAMEWIAEESGIEAEIRAIDAEIAAKKATLRAIEAEDLYNDRQEERESLENEIKELRARKRKLRQDHREKSKGIIIDRGTIYETTAPVYTNEDGNLEQVYEDGERRIFSTLPPNIAINLNAKTEYLPAGYAALLLHRATEKCLDNGGKGYIFFPFAEVYEMAGILSKDPSTDEKRYARKIFSRAVNNLSHHRIGFYAKNTDTPLEPNKAFIYDGKATASGMRININADMARWIKENISRIAESENVKNLPSAALKMSYWKLRLAENWRANKTLWTIEELCEALGYSFDKTQKGRARAFISKTMDEFRLAELLDTFEETEGGYTLRTIDQARQGIFSAKYATAGRIAKRLGIDPTSARQALERNDWNEEAAIDDIKATRKERAARRNARKRKAKPNGDS